MKTSKLILVLLFISNILFAQDKNDIAKSYYLNAENLYSTGKYNESVSVLEKSIEVLGNTNAKIQYLKVKSFLGIVENNPFDLIHLLRARYDLKLFFKLVDKNSFNKEKYDEMVGDISIIESKIEVYSMDRKAYKEALSNFSEESWDKYLNSKKIKSKSNYDNILRIKQNYQRRKSEYYWTYNDSSLYLTGEALSDIKEIGKAQLYMEQQALRYFSCRYYSNQIEGPFAVFNKNFYRLKKMETIQAQHLAGNISGYNLIDSILNKHKGFLYHITIDCIAYLCEFEVRGDGLKFPSNYNKYWTNRRNYIDDYYLTMARKCNWRGENKLYEKYMDSVKTNSSEIDYLKGWGKLINYKNNEANDFFQKVINSKDADEKLKLTCNALMGNIDVINRNFKSVSIADRSDLYYRLFYHYVLNNNQTKAIEALEQALIYGYNDRNDLEFDVVLKEFRKLKEYKELTDYYFSIY